MPSGPASPTSSPLVSVVVPAYGVTAYIAEALDSVLAQTFTDYEIIVVNDGSPDTAELERVLAPYRGRIVYLTHENRGLAGARNTAIRAARGRWIGLLDGDDAWEPDFLASQVAILEKDPSLAVLYADARVFGNSPIAGRTIMEGCPSRGEITFEKLVSRESTVVLPATMVRRDAVVNAGMFDESLRRTEDIDMWLRILLEGGRIGYQCRVLARYRRRPGNLSSDETAMIDSYLRVLEKIRRHPALTPGQLHTVQRQIVHERARLNLAKARGCFRAGDFSTASAFLRQANTHFQKRTFALASLLMNLAPNLLYRAYQLRRRYLLKGNLAS